jgi:hypothetical protein
VSQKAGGQEEKCHGMITLPCIATELPGNVHQLIGIIPESVIGIIPES